jgi:hypothetical protein
MLMPSVIMPSVTIESIIMNIIKLSVVMLNVVAPLVVDHFVNLPFCQLAIIPTGTNAPLVAKELFRPVC